MTNDLPDRRRLLAFLLMIAVALMIGSLDIYLPALPVMRTYFKTSEYSLQMSLMLGPFTSALVGIIYGRLSDIYGRRSLLFSAFAFFIAGGLFCCFSSTIELFFFNRFIQSIGSGGISILGIVIIGEMFQGRQYARYMGIYGTLFPVVFATAPIIGAQLTVHFGWQSCFVFNNMAMLVVATALRILLPETLKKDQSVNQGGLQELIGKGKMLFQNREFMLMAFGHTLPICMSAIFTSSASFIFIDSFKFTPTVYSFLQSIPIIFNFMGVLIYRQIVLSQGLKGTLRLGLAGFALFLVLLTLLVANILPATPFPILAVVCMANISMSFVIASCATRAYEIFPRDRGLAVSIVAMTRNLTVAFVVSMSALFFNGTIYPVLIAMAMTCIIVMCVLVAVLQKRNLSFATDSQSTGN